MLIVANATPAHASQKDFCAGYQRGYSAAYKQKYKTSMRPLPQMCPMMPARLMMDPTDDYEFGFQIGLEKGRYS